MAMVELTGDDLADAKHVLDAVFSHAMDIYECGEAPQITELRKKLGGREVYVNSAFVLLTALLVRRIRRMEERLHEALRALGENADD